ncbi:MAG: hypothetical protein DRN91_06115, partial [Candidatus Alkanophagales archaeon]
QIADGRWLSLKTLRSPPISTWRDIALREPKEQATAFHATDICKACGSCVLRGERSPLCPSVISLDFIELGEQGWGPARNITAFTGGDIACCPEFYGMTYLQGRIDAFWLQGLRRQSAQKAYRSL